MIKSVLAHPLTRGLDIDDPRTTGLHREIIQSKRFLRKILVLVVLLVIAANAACLLRWPWLFVIEPLLLYLSVVVIGRITTNPIESALSVTCDGARAPVA
jgi:hypothetical protein